MTLLLDHIYHGDCRSVLERLPERSVDLIFADPPYNLQLRGELWRPNMTQVDAVDDAWDQFDDFDAYDRFTREWLSACRRVLKDTGTLWVIGSYHNIYRVGSIMQDLGFWFLNDVVWVKCLAGDTELFCLINDRPIVTNLKDLARIDPQTNSIKVPSYDEGGCFTWVDVAGFSQTEKERGLRIVCEDGSWVECTPEHRFPVMREGEIEFVPAHMLTTNDTLLQLGRFEMPVAIHSSGVDEALGEFIGWYLAEGSLLDAEDGLQLAMCVDEQKEAEQLIDLIRERYGVVGRTHVYGNSLVLVFSSRFIVALIQRFVRGKDAKTKRLTRDAFLFGSEFLRGVLSGYLKGDGHWDEKSQRWRLGFCRNEGLVTDLAVVCRTLGYRLRFANGFVPYKRGQTEVIRGENRENRDARWSYASIDDLGLPSRRFFVVGQRYSLDYWRSHYKLITRKSPEGSMTPLAQQVLEGDLVPVRIKEIGPGTVGRFYDIGLLTNHVFALANGILTHNSNPMPQFRGVRFTNAHETLLWAKKSKGQKRYTFNYHTMKAMNEGKQMRSDWLLPLCTGGERLRVDGEKLHSTQKPEALLYRVLLSSSNPGEVVLDPFFGSGTTGAVARRLGRRFVGVEREQRYIEAARERIAAVEPATGDAEIYGLSPSRRNAPRVAFSALLEVGLLLPGAELYFDARRDCAATVLADGTLRTEDGIRGSIHQVAAQVAHQPACNGWDHWCYEDERGELVPIGNLRERIRAGDGEGEAAS